ncbi:hypothetical protein SSX86_011887 [Deinandra increscens subsp. villosa]|uniref:Cytochrome P450 n=1 Tax=Deinandra increscens subsp. villosa TaxID=3103831 RepID=A0AAP0D4T8_9ASTR
MSVFEGYFFPFTICLISTIIIIRALFKSTTGDKTNHPPSPFSLPIIGHLHLLAPTPHQAFHRFSKRYGPVIQFRMGSEPSVVACSAETAKEFLKTYENVYSDRPQNSAVVYITYGSQDFAFAPFGAHWKGLKKIVMSQLLNDRSDEIKRFVKSLSESAKNGKPVSLISELVKVTNNLITRTVLGQRCSEKDGDADDIRRLVFEINEVIGTFNLSDNISLFKRLDLHGFGKRVKDIHARFDVLIARIIDEHEEARKQGKQPERKDLLNILLDIQEDEGDEMQLSRINVKAFVMNIFVAGTDNSANTTEWALAELINHPKVLKKAREEIERVVGKNRLLVELDIPNLPYLQAIMKETLRLHPPVPLIPRKSTEDRIVAGYDIPAKTTVFINVWSIGRDPNYWENPLEFRPERFLDNPLDVRGQHYEFLPFGSGRRMCLITCFDWKDENLTSVNMGEALGFNLPRSSPLVCTPMARLDPTILLST